jgi:hypothetical protein
VVPRSIVRKSALQIDDTFSKNVARYTGYRHYFGIVDIDVQKTTTFEFVSSLCLELDHLLGRLAMSESWLQRLHTAHV